MNLNLQNQILLPIALAIVVGLGLSTYSNIQTLVRNENVRVQNQIDNLFQALSTTSFPLNQSVLLQVEQISGIHLVVVKETTVNSSFETKEISPKWIKSLDRQQFNSVVSVSGQDFALFQKQVPARTMKLFAFYPRKQFSNAIKKVVYPQLISGGITLLVVGALVIFISKSVTSPIQSLKLHVGKIAEGDFSEMRYDRKDEIGQLFFSINEMAQKLKFYEKQIRAHEKLLTLDQMGGGIAHQMRNSITGCRLALDFHSQSCHGDSESLEVANRQLRFMEDFQKQFLANASEMSRDKSRVDLVEIIRDYSKLLTPLARHLNVKFSVSVPDASIWILGNCSLIQQLAGNLVTNAIEAASNCATSNEKTVRVEIKSHGTQAELLVLDSGPGIPEKIQNQLFEPLVTTKPDGVGLGLAIAKQTVAEHNGTINWESTNLGTRFVVQFPLSVE
ncbi:MAG: HAMP domain-containing sensor histidine kinase [Planctomycetota bacterium]|nr:HAMP domain-containing sensor histidine kinase [Planctomycetota bacterium]